MRVMSLQQGSPDWLLWRAKGIGSSDAPVILHGRHFSTTIENLWKEKVMAYHGIKALKEEDRPPRRWDNPAMRRGRELEESVREWYENWVGFKCKPTTALHETHDFLKASYDGWNPKEQIVLEIKCPGMKKTGESDHYPSLKGEIPTKYIPQLTHLCLVTGLENVKAHYVSRGDENTFKGLDLYAMVEWIPSKSLMQELLEKELEFWDCVKEIRQPVRRE